MDWITFSARLVLAVVFLVAGAAKLRDPPGTRRALAGFGVPARLAGTAALVLPLAEITVAVLLVPDRTAIAGVAGALAMLAVFTGAVAVTLARGRRPDCNCFGQIHPRPIGPATLARNAVLGLLAVLVLAGGSGDAAGRVRADVAGMDAATALAAAALAVAVAGVALGVWAAMHLLRQQGRILLALDSLTPPGGPASPPPGRPVGAPAPAFALPTTSGERVTLGGLLPVDRPLLLVFVSPGCGPCNTLLPRIDLRRNGGPAPGLAVVVTRGDPDSARAMAAEHRLPPPLVDEDGSVGDAYLITATPAAVAVGPGGIIRSEPAIGPDAVVGLRERVGRDGLPHGEPVPDIALPDARGRRVSLRDAARGAPHLILFWSPTCGYCTEILDEVRALERRDDLPPMLIVASVGAGATRDQGLRSTILLDPGFARLGEALGVTGTPSALRLDEHGHVVSRLAVGVDQVLALAGSPPVIGAGVGGGASPPPHRPRHR